jgi:hypothetical protein
MSRGYVSFIEVGFMVNICAVEGVSNIKAEEGQEDV